MSQVVKPNTIPTKRLSASISSSATSFQLSDILGWDGEALVTANFGDNAYGCFRDVNGTRLELFEFDPTTIGNSTITILKRGLNFDGDRTTQVTANKLEWVKGSTLVELGTTMPQFFQWLKEYIDAASIAGAVPAAVSTLGIVKTSVAPVSSSNPIVVGDNDPRIFPNAYAASVVGTDAYAINPSPAITAYTAGQMFGFKADVGNTGPCTLNVNGLGAKSIKKNTNEDLITGNIIAGQIITVMYDGTNFQFLGATNLKFGGTGADGALSITSGTTTLDLGSANEFVKNYTSISITGTGVLAFSNPGTNGTLITLKSQGAVTITSSATRAIDLRNLGGSGASSSSGYIAGSNGLGIGCPYPTAGETNGSTANYLVFDKFLKSGKGARLSASIAMRTRAFFCGAGGSLGTVNSGTVTSGRGGGGLFIECGGDLNITGTIDASGQAGTDASGSGGSGSNSSGGRGGGGNVDSDLPVVASANVTSMQNLASGGGGGGCIIILYNGALIANSATLTVTGGPAGATGSGLAASAGGIGFSLVAANTELA